MPLVACDGAKGAGGAVFHTARPGGANPTISGASCLLVGDSAMCPGHGSPEHSVIQTGSRDVTVEGTPVAMVGSQTSCGHPLVSAGGNAFFTAT